MRLMFRCLSSLLPREGCEAEMTFTNILDIPDIALVENASSYLLEMSVFSTF